MAVFLGSVNVFAFIERIARQSLVAFSGLRLPFIGCEPLKRRNAQIVSSLLL